MAKKQITKAEMLAIKRLLGIPQQVPFPRCRSKDKVIVREFEAKGDFSHSGPEYKHICHLCRCKNTAGMGTKGDFYGLGEHTGHYGVGFCRRHERCRRKGHAHEYALNHMKAIQQYGLGAEVNKEYMESVKHDALVARDRSRIREGLNLIVDKMKEFESKCVRSRQKETVITKQLKDLASAIRSAEFVDPKQAEEIVELLRDRIFLESDMTETAGGAIIPMTDKTKFQTAALLAKAIAQIEKDKFVLDNKDYLHRDEIAIRIPQMIALMERFILNEQDRKEYLKEFKAIWMSARPGVR